MVKVQLYVWGDGMTDFSIGDALGSGFGLMGRRPFSVLAWGLVYILLGMVLPVGLMMGMVGSDFVSYFANLHYHASDPQDFARMMMPMNGRIMLINPIMQLTSLVVQAVLTAAVFRATLEPRNRGLAYLGLGGREWWLMVLNFAARVLVVLLIVGMALAGGALALGLNAVFEAQHVDKGARILAYVVIGVVLLALFFGILVRFSMAAVMTFAERRFRLFESWSLTRRHGWKLFALALLLVLVSIVLVIVFEGIGAAIVLVLGGMAHWNAPAFLASLQDQHRLWTSGLGEGLVVLVLFCAYAFGGLFAVSVAPWAVVYRELLPRPAPAAGGLFADEPAPVPAPLSDHAHHQDAHTEEHGHGHADPHASVADDGHGHHDDHGHDAHGHDSHGHEDHGHGHDDHGHDAHGHDDHGHGHDDGHGGGGHGHGH